MKLEILVVDDDSIITMLHSAVLMKCGVKNIIEILDDGDTALDYLEGHPNNEQTKFLILLDINMPRMSGWEFLDELQNKPYKDNCIVIMVTSSVDKSDKERSSTYRQVVDYIEKPFLPRHLDTLKQVVDLEIIR